MDQFFISRFSTWNSESNFAGSKLHGVTTDVAKAMKESESLFLSGHVTGVEYHRISPNLSYCFIRAVIARQKAQTEAPYITWVVLHKHTGNVESAFCECPAGLRGYCKHVIAILHLVVREVEGGCIVNKACTSKPQMWHKPHTKGKKVNQPDFVKNLTIRKVKGNFDSSPKGPTKVNRLNYDPRAFCFQKKKTLSDFWSGLKIVIIRNNTVIKTEKQMIS